jgi:hypothetical protein
MQKVEQKDQGKANASGRFSGPRTTVTLSLSLSFPAVLCLSKEL